MVLTKQQRHKNSLIQKEQQQLLKIQKELDSLLVKVNEGINVLKVEQLQLKSSVAVSDRHVKQQHIDEPAHLDLNPSVSHFSARGIQETPSLNLDINMHKAMEYEDEDDDEI